MYRFLLFCLFCKGCIAFLYLLLRVLFQPDSCSFLWRLICSLVYRVLSSVLRRTGFVVINSFGLFLSWKLLIFPLSVTGSFAGYSSLGWQLLSSSIALNRAFQALLTFKDLVVESDVTCASLLPLSTYHFCSRYLVFEVVNLGCEFCWACLWGFFFFF